MIRHPLLILMKKLITFIFLIILSSSCIFKQRKKSNAKAPLQLQSLSIGIMPSMDYIPFAVARQAGIYDSLGLSVNFNVYYSAEERDLAFHRGLEDGIITDIPCAILQQNRYDNGKIIMQTDGYYSFIAKKTAKSISSLKNDNIAVSHNTAIDFLTGIAMQEAHVMTHVNKPEINKITMRLTTLLDNKNKFITAAFLPDPAATIALKTGKMNQLINSDQMGYHLNVFMVSKEALTNKRYEIQTLIKGYNLAIAYIKAHPRKIWDKNILYQLNIDKKTALSIDIPHYLKATLPSERDIRLSRIWLRAKGMLSPQSNTYHLIDSTFCTDH